MIHAATSYFQQIYNRLEDKFPASIGVILLFAALLYAPVNSWAQEIGGPYKKDSSTVLLMHFNGNLQNETNRTASPVEHGTINFKNAENLGLPKRFDQLARFQNGSPSDSTWVMVPDTASLDLTGSWTIEFWVNVFTFGESSDDHRYQPRFVNKPGDPWYQANYWIYARGAPRNFYTGYREDVGAQGSYQDIISPQNTLQPGKWYHFAYIRDTSKNVHVQLLHKLNEKGNLERIFFGTKGFDPVTESPPTTNDNPLFIGNAYAGGSFYLDGYMDELRISTTVRNYPMPPVIRNVEQLGNQPSTQDYSVRADIVTLGDSQVASATLHYRINGGTFKEVSMSQGQDGYVGTIPSQQVGDKIQYYVEATDQQGRTSLDPARAKQDTNFYQFAIWKPQTKTLDLSFEGGSGTPVDSSLYENPVTVVNGKVNYSTDAAKGSYAIHFTDSTYLRVDSPFLTSDRLRAELWFKPDSLIGGRRLLVSPTSPWWQTNAQIWFANDTQIKAGGYFPNVGYMETTMDSSIMANKWYHAIYQVMPDSIMLEIRDANNNLISRTFTSHQGATPIAATQPFHIGNTPAEDHQFYGLVDEVKVYNYPTDTTFATAIEDNKLALPKTIQLKQNYPNPFNPTTNITYKLPHSTNVTLTVYNMLGRKVETLVNSKKQAGTHTVKFKAQGLASGIYFYRLRADGVTRSHKMLLLK